MSLKDPNVVRPSARRRVAIVVANPAVSTTTGWPVGFWWSELTHPYLAFDEAGYDVDVFSADGGRCEADAMSDPDDAVWRYGLLPRDRHVMPWRIEDEMKALGANYVQAGLWRGFAVRDGNLVTGQQNFSGTETARLVVEALGR